MSRHRIVKRQDGAFIELPPELSGNGELELFKLKDGFYLLSVPLGKEDGQGEARAPEGNVGLSQDERLVLKKLLAIRFENRTPEHVAQTFSDDEKAVLRILEERRFVNVFKGDKYRYGVYNINDHAYSLLRQAESAPRQDQVAQRPIRQNTIGQSHQTLMKQGYTILRDKEEARVLSEVLGKDMRQGLIFGVKGFDGKFYIVTRDYLVRGQNSINLILTEDMEAGAIAMAAKLEPEGCIAILNLMADRGEIIEKRKGVFAPA